MKNRFFNTVKKLLAVFTVGALLSLAGCEAFEGLTTGGPAPGEFPVTIGDVTVNSKPGKAVALSSSTADIILALGCETQLAAGEEECTQESLAELRKVSADDAQAIIDVGPDLVISDQIDGNVAAALTEAGITVLVVEPAVDRADFERLYAQVGSAFLGGTSGYDQGIECAQDIFLTLDNISRIVPKDKITTGCYLYDLDGSAVTGDMLASDIMSYSGVTNAFGTLTGGVYEFESLRVSNPDIIFCVPGLREQILSDSRFDDFRAVVNNKIIELDPELMRRQGRTVVEASYEMCAAAYPELLEESSAEVTLPPEPTATPEPTLPPESSDESYPDLVPGESNEDILKMQTRLAELGYLDTEYDGFYGDYTVECVKDFQANNGLEETGVADSETQRVMFSDSAVAK